MLTGVVLQALLSDSLLCFYDALKASERARLGVTYMLIRKPIQESLYLFESLVLNPTDFGDTLSIEPLKLRAGKAGGVEVHEQRINNVLDTLKDNRFNARYLAQLRYNKKAGDSFDGICNQAMHLFTEHESIRTSPLNINFIFSDPEAKLSQWKFLYSRLPYVLAYFHAVVEYLLSRLSMTHPLYLEDISSRVAAQVCLWSDTIEPQYRNEELAVFVSQTHKWLIKHCAAAGFPAPTLSDLKAMGKSGAYPGESPCQTQYRQSIYITK